MQTLSEKKQTAHSVQKEKRSFLSKLLEFDFSLQSKEISGKVVETYMVFMLTAYPLFLFRESWMGISVKLLLYYAVTVSTFFVAVILGLEQKFEFRKPKELLDYIVLAFGGWNLLLTFVRIVNGKGDYRQNLLCMGLAIAFYMLTTGFSWYRYYTDLFLISGAVVMLWLFIHYLVQPEFAAAGMLLSNQQARSAYMLLIAAVAGAEYMDGRQKENDIFYLVVTGVASVILFLGQSRSFLLLGLGVTIAMPLFFKETAEHVKRGVILIFLYLFLYSNMSLLASYSGLLRVETSFNLMNSVYLDLAIAAAGVLFFSCWDKIPEDANLEELTLPWAGRAFKWCLTAVGILATVAVLGAKRLGEMGKEGLEKSLCDFAVGLSGELQNGQNAFTEMMAEAGVLGAGILILLCIALIEKGRHKREEEIPAYMRIVGLLFLLLLFLMPVSEAVAPLFILFGAYALYGTKEERHGKKSDCSGKMKRK